MLQANGSEFIFGDLTAKGIVWLSSKMISPYAWERAVFLIKSSNLDQSQDLWIHGHLSQVTLSHPLHPSCSDHINTSAASQTGGWGRGGTKSDLAECLPALEAGTYIFIFPANGKQVSLDRFLSHPARNPSAIENAVNTFSHKLLVQEAVLPVPHSLMALCTPNKKEAFHWKWQIRTPTSVSRRSLENLFFIGMKRHQSIKSPFFL